MTRKPAPLVNVMGVGIRCTGNGYTVGIIRRRIIGEVLTDAIPDPHYCSEPVEALRKALELHGEAGAADGIAESAVRLLGLFSGACDPETEASLLEQERRRAGVSYRELSERTGMGYGTVRTALAPRAPGTLERIGSSLIVDTENARAS